MKTALACIFFLGVSILHSAGISAGNASAVDGSRINIAYSTNVLGYYLPCNCLDGEQLGGLDKRAQFLNQYKKDHGDILVVDSGDLLNEDPEIPEDSRAAATLKADLIARIYKATGIDAVTPGELDLVLGLKTLKELENKYNFPFVAANLVDAKGKLIFQPYIIRKIDGKTVGVFGIIGDTSEIADKVNEVTGGAATVTDSLKAAESVVQELSGKVDYVVALTHEGTNRDWVIARRVKGINLVVGGHDKRLTKDPSVAGSTLIVQAGEKSEYAGMLQIATDGSMAASNTLVPLGDSMAKEPKIEAMIAQYNETFTAMYGVSNKSKLAAGKVSIDSPAPDFTIQDGDRTVSLRDYHGKVVVLNFWATWCAPCVKEMPSLVNLQNRLKDHVTVLAVSTDTNSATYHRFIRDHNVTLVTVRDPAKKSSTIYGASQFPVTYVIDREGKIRREFSGPQNWDDPKIELYLKSLYRE